VFIVSTLGEPWIGGNFKVTSFRDDKQSFVACSYKLDENKDETRKIDKRITVTLDEVKAAEKARKAAEQAAKDTDEIAALWKRAKLDEVPRQVMAKWAPDDRDAARAWANEVVRVGAKAGDPPAHVQQGMAWGREVQAAHKKWSAKDYEGKLEDYLPKGSTLLAFLGVAK
jgi:hypothetical protein